jgi:hypothetical protein
MNIASVRPYLRLRFLLPALAVVAGLVVLLERLILTDAERIGKVLDRIERCSLEGRWDDAFAFLDPSLRLEGLTKEELRAHVRTTLGDRPLKKWNVMEKKVEVQEGGVATVYLRVLIEGPPGSPLQQPYAYDFDIGFRKVPDAGWVIVSVLFKG